MNLRVREALAHFMKAAIAIAAAAAFGIGIASWSWGQGIRTAPEAVDGCVFSSTAPTLAAGQVVAFQCGPDGSLAVQLRATSNALQGITPTVTAGAGATSTVLKAGAGNLYRLAVTNLTAGPGMVITLNTSTIPAATATVAPIDCRPIGSSTAQGFVNMDYGSFPEVFSAGIVALLNPGTSCSTLTSTGALTGYMDGQVK
jgi:hypothetical protein